MGAWIPGVIQGAQAKNAQRDLKRANADLTGNMYRAGMEYEQRRPQAAAEKMAVLRKQMGLYAPQNAMMGEMTGGKYSLNLDPIGQSPLQMKPTQAQADRGNDTGFAGADSGYQNQRVAELQAQGYDTSDLQKLTGAQHLEAQRGAAAGASAIRNTASNLFGRPKK